MFRELPDESVNRSAPTPHQILPERSGCPSIYCTSSLLLCLVYHIFEADWCMVSTAKKNIKHMLFSSLEDCQCENGMIRKNFMPSVGFICQLNGYMFRRKISLATKTLLCPLNQKLIMKLLSILGSNPTEHIFNCGF